MIYMYGTQGKVIFCNYLGGIEILPLFVKNCFSLNNIECLNKGYFEYILDTSLYISGCGGKIYFPTKGLIDKYNPCKLILLVDKPNCIIDRMKRKYKLDWSKEYIEELQYKEFSYIKTLARSLKCDYQIIYNSANLYKKFGQSIVLPIKPIYAEKIMSGEKKYEYRKRICNRYVDKIYIYETAPVKKIIGECDIIGVCNIKKECLWSMTKKHAGISEQEFKKYFENEEQASAYAVANPRRYKKTMTLSEKGIDYVLQSYTYVATE